MGMTIRKGKICSLGETPRVAITSFLFHDLFQTVCDYTENAAHDLADGACKHTTTNSTIFDPTRLEIFQFLLTDLRQFDSAIRSHNPEWYRKEMKLSGYIRNGL